MPTRKRAASAKKVTPVKKATTVKSVKTSTHSFVSREIPVKENVKVYTRNPRLWVGVMVVIILILLYLYKGIFVAAIVNGQPIARLSVIHQLEQQSGKQALDNLIAESLVMQEAKKRHVVISQAVVNNDIAKIEATLKQQGTTLDAALAARGLTRSQLVDQIKLQKMLDKMVGASINVSDADVQAYIDKNQDSLPKDLSDDNLKKQVRQQLQQQQLQDKTQAFLADLQKKAQIQFFVNY